MTVQYKKTDQRPNLPSETYPLMRQILLSTMFSGQTNTRPILPLQIRAQQYATLTHCRTDSGAILYLKKSLPKSTHSYGNLLSR
jgi:hypothetical protein